MRRLIWDMATGAALVWLTVCNVIDYGQRHDLDQRVSQFEDRHAMLMDKLGNIMEVCE